MGSSSTASTLTLDGTGSQLLSTAVTGNINFGGKLVQQGGGTWIVDKNLTAADTTIAAGSTLQLGNGGAIGSVAGSITANGTLAINRSGTLTLNHAISGTGGFSQTGTGTTILTANNTYGGGTQVNAGVLSVQSDSNLGDASGAVTFGGGTFKNTAAITTGRTFYANASNSTFQTDADLVITTPVQGSGNLIKTGAATLVLADNSTYAGNTTISAGTLQVGNGGTRGRLAFGPVTNNATLAFSRIDDEFIDSNPISGTGNVVQKGTGTLILAGNNTYEGGTSLNAGVISVFSDSNLGHAAGALTFNGGALQNTAAFTTARAITLNAGGTIQTDATLNATGVIDGTGGLTKIGASNLILSGANAYTGATTVNAGTLSVNGSITSATTVNSGGVLGGNGNVGNVTIAGGGTLAPGNSIGTLTVNGNLTFAPGSIYRVETDAAGNADRVNVVGAPGTVTINGGTVDVQAGAGNYARNTRYTILSSTGATTGAFTGVSSNLAFLTPRLSYLPNGVTLSLLSENAPSYNTVAQTPNQASVANYLNSFANTPGSAAAAALIQQIDNLSADQARVAFDSLSGSSHAAASQIAGAMGRNFSTTLATRSSLGLGSSTSASSTAGLKATKAPLFAGLSPSLLTRPGDVMSDSPLRVAAADPSGDTQDRPALQSVGGLWGQAMGTGGRTGSDGNGPASRYSASGFVFGYDKPITSNWLAGVALAYNKAQWDAGTNGVAPASGRVNSPQAGLYARYTAGPWEVRLDGTYSDHRFSTDRTVTIGNAMSIARSNHGGTEWALAAQAEYSLPSGDWDIRPLAGLRHARLSEGGITETGAGAASLTVDARRSQNTVASLGVKLAKPLGDQGGKLQLSAIASHLMGDNDSPLSSRLAGQATSFTAAGTPIKRSALTLGGTLTGQLSRGLSAYADAAYEYRGAGQNAFMFTAGMRLSW